MSVEKSQALLKRAEAVIPLGAQTFSKSKLAYPEGSPLFVTHGSGGYVWDVDGNKYIDMVSGLLPNVLGYCDQDVDWAIKRQVDCGISFSLSTELEVELAERLKKHIPCAEMSRFGKTGTDVTSAAVRLARAYTGRDNVIVCGYHGWQDWSICTKNPLGIPLQVCELTETCPPGELDDLSADTLEEAAAVIIEASAGPEHLLALQKRCREAGAVFIMDEVITGFRWHIGGAQKYYGITPDLACFGKAMGNGMPISALCGKAEIMQLMDKVFFSGTFFGETLSLAAAIATIDKIERENVCERLWKLAGRCGGDTPWQRISFPDDGAKALYVEMMRKRGILTNGTLNWCFAHTDKDCDEVWISHAEASAAIACGERAEALRPIFNMRAA